MPIVRKKRVCRIPINTNALRALIEDGYTVAEAAEELHCSEKWVRIVARRRLNMSFPRKGMQRPEARLEVINAIKEGADTTNKVKEVIGKCRDQAYKLVRSLIKDRIILRIKRPGIRSPQLVINRSVWGDDHTRDNELD